MLSRLQYLWESCVGVKFMSLYILKVNVRLVGFCWLLLVSAGSCCVLFPLLLTGASWRVLVLAAACCCLLLVSPACCWFLWLSVVVCWFSAAVLFCIFLSMFPNNTNNPNNLKFPKFLKFPKLPLRGGLIGIDISYR